MKTLATFLLVLVFQPGFTIINNPYDDAMKGALEELNQAGSLEDFQSAANHFDRIANVEKDKWLPSYYAAYAKVMLAAMQQDLEQKDPYLDAAQENLDAVAVIEHDESERLALQGFLTMIRMSVDPARGMELGMNCGMTVEQAYALNNENPRALLMLAQFKHGSAQYMGQDTSEYCAMFEEVLEMLDQPAQEGSDPFSPRWGKNMTTMLLQQCQK